MVSQETGDRSFCTAPATVVVFPAPAMAETSTTRLRSIRPRVRHSSHDRSIRSPGAGGMASRARSTGSPPLRVGVRR